MLIVSQTEDVFSYPSTTFPCPLAPKTPVVMVMKSGPEGSVHSALCPDRAFDILSVHSEVCV